MIPELNDIHVAKRDFFQHLLARQLLTLDGIIIMTIIIIIIININIIIITWMASSKTLCFSSRPSGPSSLTCFSSRSSSLLVSSSTLALLGLPFNTILGLLMN